MQQSNSSYLSMNQGLEVQTKRTYLVDNYDEADWEALYKSEPVEQLPSYAHLTRIRDELER